MKRITTRELPHTAEIRVQLYASMTCPTADSLNRIYLQIITTNGSTAPGEVVIISAHRDRYAR